MLHFIGVVFLQSLKWAIMFIYTRDQEVLSLSNWNRITYASTLYRGGGTAIYGLGTYLPLRQVGFCLSSSVWRVDKNQRVLAYIGYHLWDIDQLYVNSEFLAYSKSGIEKWFIDMVYCLSDGVPSRTPQPKFLECPLPPSTTPLPDSDASAVHSF